jgi:hypothetical protein
MKPPYTNQIIFRLFCHSIFSENGKLENWKIGKLENGSDLKKN